MGPLHGLKVLEIVGSGPGPFAAIMLADMGAEVIRVDSADRVGNDGPNATLGVDLKHPAGAATVMRLLEQCDVLIDGFRPGVMERLGLGPELCLALNPRLVYGRMTGPGQTDGQSLAFGVLCALRHAETSGRGQVVDAAKVELPRAPVRTGANTIGVLAEFGFNRDEIAVLRREGAVA